MRYELTHEGYDDVEFKSVFEIETLVIDSEEGHLKIIDKQGLVSATLSTKHHNFKLKAIK